MERVITSFHDEGFSVPGKRPSLEVPGAVRRRDGAKLLQAFWIAYAEDVLFTPVGSRFFVNPPCDLNTRGAQKTALTYHGSGLFSGAYGPVTRTCDLSDLARSAFEGSIACGIADEVAIFSLAGVDWEGIGKFCETGTVVVLYIPNVERHGFWVEKFDLISPVPIKIGNRSVRALDRVNQSDDVDAVIYGIE